MTSASKTIKVLLGEFVFLLLCAFVGQAAAQTWMELAPTGGPPPVRCYGASTVYDSASNRLILFGGNGGCPGFSFNDVWVLTNADGTGGTPQWIQISPTGGPPTGPEQPHSGLRRRQQPDDHL